MIYLSLKHLLSDGHILGKKECLGMKLIVLDGDASLVLEHAGLYIVYSYNYQQYVGFLNSYFKSCVFNRISIGTQSIYHLMT